MTKPTRTLRDVILEHDFELSDFVFNEVYEDDTQDELDQAELDVNYLQECAEELNLDYFTEISILHSSVFDIHKVKVEAKLWAKDA